MSARVLYYYYWLVIWWGRLTAPLRLRCLVLSIQIPHQFTQVRDLLSHELFVLPVRLLLPFARRPLIFRLALKCLNLHPQFRQARADEGVVAPLRDEAVELIEKGEDLHASEAIPSAEGGNVQ